MKDSEISSTESMKKMNNHKTLPKQTNEEKTSEEKYSYILDEDDGWAQLNDAIKQLVTMAQKQSSQHFYFSKMDADGMTLQKFMYYNAVAFKITESNTFDEVCDYIVARVVPQLMSRLDEHKMGNSDVYLRKLSMLWQKIERTSWAVSTLFYHSLNKRWSIDKSAGLESILKQRIVDALAHDPGELLCALSALLDWNLRLCPVVERDLKKYLLRDIFVEISEAVPCLQDDWTLCYNALSAIEELGTQDAKDTLIAAMKNKLQRSGYELEMLEGSNSLKKDGRKKEVFVRVLSTLPLFNQMK